jgi:hypothetical protein
MQRATRILLATAAGVLLLAASAMAHHSFTGEFDILAPVTVEGTITKVSWVNPHIQVYLDAKDDTGKQASWQMESWNTANMRRAGIRRDMLAVGTKVKIRGYKAKVKPNFAYLRNITFPDGQEFELWVGGAQGRPEEQN